MCHLYPYNNVKLLRKFFTLIFAVLLVLANFYMRPECLTISISDIFRLAAMLFATRRTISIYTICSFVVVVSWSTQFTLEQYSIAVSSLHFALLLHFVSAFLSHVSILTCSNPVSINKADGSPCENEDEVLLRWKEHFRLARALPHWT